MNITFRQGIITFQKTPRFINVTTSGTINLNSDISPTLVTFADGKQNYLLIESSSIVNAWGIIPPDSEVWLYWDIDKNSTNRTFGVTGVKPAYGSIFPLSPELDAHFFNKVTNKMMVWDGGHWIPKIRVFAGKVCNGVLNPEGIYSQVNIYGAYTTDTIIKDGYREPVNRFDSTGNFEMISDNNINNLTTFSNLANLKYSGTSEYFGIASENIPKHFCVTWGVDNTIRLASPLDSINSCIGISENSVETGGICRVVRDGFILNRNDWTWQSKENTSIFVGVGGIITTDMSEVVSTQKIGHIVNHKLIFVNIQEQILIDQII